LSFVIYHLSFVIHRLSFVISCLQLVSRESSLSCVVCLLFLHSLRLRVGIVNSLTCESFWPFFRFKRHDQVQWISISMTYYGYLKFIHLHDSNKSSASDAI